MSMVAIPKTDIKYHNYNSAVNDHDREAFWFIQSKTFKYTISKTSDLQSETFENFHTNKISYEKIERASYP